MKKRGGGAPQRLSETIVLLDSQCDLIHAEVVISLLDDESQVICVEQSVCATVPGAGTGSALHSSRRASSFVEDRQQYLQYSRAAPSVSLTIASETDAWQTAASRCGAIARCTAVESLQGTGGGTLLSVVLEWEESAQTPAAALEIGVVLTSEGALVPYCWPRGGVDAVATANLAQLFCELVECDTRSSPAAATRSKLDRFVGHFRESDFVAHDLFLKKSSTITLSDDADLLRQAHTALEHLFKYIGREKECIAQELKSSNSSGGLSARSSSSGGGSGSSSGSGDPLQSVRAELVLAANYARLNVKLYCPCCGRRHAVAGDSPRTCANHRCVTAELNEPRFVDLYSTLKQTGFCAEFLVASTLAALQNPLRRAATIGTAPDVYRRQEHDDYASAAAARPAPAYPGQPPPTRPLTEDYDYGRIAEELAWLQRHVSFPSLAAAQSNADIRVVLVEAYLKYWHTHRRGSSSSSRAAAPAAPTVESASERATRENVCAYVRASDCPTFNPTSSRDVGGGRIARAMAALSRQRARASSSSSSDAEAIDIDRFNLLLYWVWRRITHVGTHSVRLTRLSRASQLPASITKEAAFIQTVSQALMPAPAALGYGYGVGPYGALAAPSSNMYASGYPVPRAPAPATLASLDALIAGGSLLLVRVERNEASANIASDQSSGREFRAASQKMHSASAALQAAAGASRGPDDDEDAIEVGDDSDDGCIDVDAADAGNGFEILEAGPFEVFDGDDGDEGNDGDYSLEEEDWEEKEGGSSTSYRGRRSTKAAAPPSKAGAATPSSSSSTAFSSKKRGRGGSMHRTSARAVPTPNKGFARAAKAPKKAKAKKRPRSYVGYAPPQPWHGSSLTPSESFLWHGSGIGNWTCIIRDKIKILSNTTHMTAGAVYGPGIYMGEQFATSYQYSGMAAGIDFAMVKAAPLSSSSTAAATTSSTNRNGFCCVAVVKLGAGAPVVGAAGGGIRVATRDSDVSVEYLVILQGRVPYADQALAAQQLQAAPFAAQQQQQLQLQQAAAVAAQRAAAQAARQATALAAQQAAAREELIQNVMAFTGASRQVATRAAAAAGELVVAVTMISDGMV